MLVTTGQELKTHLCTFVREVKTERKLRYDDLEVLGISRTALNSILNRDGHDVSVESLVNLIVSLDCKVDISASE